MRHVRFSYFRFRQGLHSDLTNSLSQTLHPKERKSVNKKSSKKLLPWDGRTYSRTHKRMIYRRRFFLQ